MFSEHYEKDRDPFIHHFTFTKLEVERAKIKWIFLDEYLS